MSPGALTEAWQRGPIPGFDPLLMPVVHALIQVREDLERLAGEVPNQYVWVRPGGAASVGYHVRHAGGALNRLFTYARGETLSDEQKAALREEGAAGDPPASLAAVVASSLLQRQENHSWTSASLGEPGCRRRCWACYSTRRSIRRVTWVKQLRRRRL
jgi:hypothetical protein